MFPEKTQRYNISLWLSGITIAWGAKRLGWLQSKNMKIEEFLGFRFTQDAAGIGFRVQKTKTRHSATSETIFLRKGKTRSDADALVNIVPLNKFPFKIDTSTSNGWRELQDKIVEFVSTLPPATIRSTGETVGFFKQSLKKALAKKLSEKERIASFSSIADIITNAVYDRSLLPDVRHHARYGQDVFLSAFEYNGAVFAVRIQADILDRHDNFTMKYAGHIVKKINENQQKSLNISNISVKLAEATPTSELTTSKNAVKLSVLRRRVGRFQNLEILSSDCKEDVPVVYAIRNSHGEGITINFFNDAPFDMVMRHMSHAILVQTFRETAPSASVSEEDRMLADDIYDEFESALDSLGMDVDSFLDGDSWIFADILSLWMLSRLTFGWVSAENEIFTKIRESLEDGCGIDADTIPYEASRFFSHIFDADAPMKFTNKWEKAFKATKFQSLHKLSLSREETPSSFPCP